MWKRYYFLLGGRGQWAVFFALQLLCPPHTISLLLYITTSISSIQVFFHQTLVYLCIHSSCLYWQRKAYWGGWEGLGWRGKGHGKNTRRRYLSLKGRFMIAFWEGLQHRRREGSRKKALAVNACTQKCQEGARGSFEEKTSSNKLSVLFEVPPFPPNSNFAFFSRQRPQCALQQNQENRKDKATGAMNRYKTPASWLPFVRI